MTAASASAFESLDSLSSGALVFALLTTAALTTRMRAVGIDANWLPFAPFDGPFTEAGSITLIRATGSGGDTTAAVGGVKALDAGVAGRGERNSKTSCTVGFDGPELNGGWAGTTVGCAASDELQVPCSNAFAARSKTTAAAKVAFIACPRKKFGVGVENRLHLRPNAPAQSLTRRFPAVTYQIDKNLAE
jgi:hypothetical protein